MGSLSQKWEKSSNQVRGVYMTSLHRTKTRYASMWELANAKQRAANLLQGLQQETAMLFSWQTGPSECPLSPSQAACSTRCIPHLLPNWHHSAQTCSRISLSRESPSAGFDNWKILRTEGFLPWATKNICLSAICRQPKISVCEPQIIHFIHGYYMISVAGRA